MIHRRGLVILGRQDQLPLAELLLGVRVGELVPVVCCGGGRRGDKGWFIKSIISSSSRMFITD